MYGNEYLLNLLVPKQFYLAVFVLYFDYIYQKFLISYPFFKKVFSNKTKLQDNNLETLENSFNTNVIHTNTIIKLSKALVILFLSRALIVTLMDSDSVIADKILTGSLSIISTSYIVSKCIPRDMLTIIMKCSINTKDRLKIVIQSDIVLSFCSLIVFQLKQWFPTIPTWAIILVNAYIVSIRFFQCIKEKNWSNMLKYGLNYPILYCQYHNIDNDGFKLLKIIQLAYGAYWDLFMDWKLQLGISKRVLNKKTTIVFVIIALLLKSAFLFNRLFNGIEVMPFVVEINRRLIWVLLRLDFEYFVL
ncbi:hypothetical protein QEN19_002159 [Hanseniaspora menglaensis]